MKIFLVNVMKPRLILKNSGKAICKDFRKFWRLCWFKSYHPTPAPCLGKTLPTGQLLLRIAMYLRQNRYSPWADTFFVFPSGHKT